jgi:hypothetical protein
MSEEAWESMMALLGAMTPGLVASDDDYSVVATS